MHNSLRAAILVSIMLAGCSTPDQPPSEEPGAQEAPATQRAPPEPTVVPAEVGTTQTVRVTLRAERTQTDFGTTGLALESITTGLETLTVNGRSVHLYMVATSVNSTNLKRFGQDALSATGGTMPVRTGDVAAFAPPSGTKSVLVFLDYGGQEASRSQVYLYDWEADRWFETRLWEEALAPPTSLRGDTLSFDVYRTTA